MKVQQIIAALAIIIVLAMGTFRAAQPDAGLLKFRAEGNIAYGHGETDDRSVATVSRFFDAHPEVDTLIFGKMGVSKDADMNLRIAREIRKRGLKTHLTPRSFIASGAVDLFLAGEQRTMECGASIGVHSWSGGRHYYPAKIGHDPRQKLQERFLTEMGIDPAFYAFTRDNALPHELYFLKPADIARFKLLTEPADCP